MWHSPLAFVLCHIVGIVTQKHFITKGIKYYRVTMHLSVWPFCLLVFLFTHIPFMLTPVTVAFLQLLS